MFTLISTIGGFAEGLALAALWKLPVVLICENNQYSMGTPLYRSLAVEDVSLRALAHGMARDRFDGDDVIKVKRRIAEAVERARTTGEPTLIEVVTYRFRGHSMSDPGLYRTKDEVEEWKRRDPLNLRLLLTTFLLTAVYFGLNQFPKLPLWLGAILAVVEHGNFWFLILLILLPLAMTMALLWKTKEVILDNVFGAEK